MTKPKLALWTIYYVQWFLGTIHENMNQPNLQQIPCGQWPVPVLLVNACFLLEKQSTPAIFGQLLQHSIELGCSNPPTHPNTGVWKKRNTNRRRPLWGPPGRHRNRTLYLPRVCFNTPRRRPTIFSQSQSNLLHFLIHSAGSSEPHSQVPKLRYLWNCRQGKITKTPPQNTTTKKTAKLRVILYLQNAFIISWEVMINIICRGFFTQEKHRMYRYWDLPYL